MVLHSNFKNSFTISYLCFSTSLFYCVSICFPFTYYVIFCVYQCSMCLANVICYPLPLYLLHSFFCLVLVVFLVQCGDFCISRICVSLFFFVWSNMAVLSHRCIRKIFVFWGDKDFVLFLLTLFHNFVNLDGE